MVEKIGLIENEFKSQLEQRELCMENFRKLFEKLQTEYDCLFEEHTRLSHVFEELQSDNCQLKAKLDAEEVKRGKIEEYKQEMERFSKKVRIGPIRP